MKNSKYISTTLPYINSTPHIGHCFEFVLADVIAEYNRLSGNDVVFNVGIDEHGQKVYQKSIEEGYESAQDFCNNMAVKWVDFCDKLRINYTNFYRTTDHIHSVNVLRFYGEIFPFIFTKEYSGKYCVGCESFITEKENAFGYCQIHNTKLISTTEINKFFDLNKFAGRIKNVLIDKSKSKELRNIIEDSFDLSITRKNVKWGIRTGDNDEVFYVWFEALLNYIFSIKYYDDKPYFDKYWENSLIICGKDNLKFQAYILQALLISNGIPQTKEILVHGNILDASGAKMSKTIGNVIDPIDQINKYGVDAVRYYLIFGLNTFDDSKYSESDLINKWNNEIVNGLGNLISRLLHLIDLKQVNLVKTELSIESNIRILNNSRVIQSALDGYHFNDLCNILNAIIFNLNRRITLEKPFDKACENYSEILTEIYFELDAVIPCYGLILKEHKAQLDEAFSNNKKVIIFNKITKN